MKNLSRSEEKRPYFRYMQTILTALPFVVILFFSGCGGGGGGGGGGGSSSTPPVITTYSISGNVTGAVSVTINLTGTATATAVTDSNGNFSFAGLANGNYTVTPTKTGYVFRPVSLAVNVSSANVSGKNFTATASTASTYSISGKISGVVLQGVTITLSGVDTGSTVTDANGNYSFRGLVAGRYTVTPTLAGYSFSSMGTIIVGTANSTANNFTSTLSPNGSTLLFTPVSLLPPATVGVSYTNSVVSNTSGGTPPYHYQSDSFATGAPPIGMIIDLNGILTGTPSVEGTYPFGVCAVDLVGASSCKTTSIKVDPPTPLTGTWVGTWVWAGPGSNGCQFSDGGSFTMSLTQTGNSFTGTTTGSGIQTRNNLTCALVSTGSGPGSASGTISGTAVTLAFDFDGSVTTLSYTGTATLNVNTLTGSITRSTGGSGSFTVTRQ